MSFDSGGKSGGGSSSSSAGGRVATAGGTKLFNQADPVIGQILQTVMQLLQGNIYGPAATPLIQRGVDASRQATSQSMQGADAYLAKIGASRSPFAAQIESQINQAGETATANVPTDIASQLLSLFGGQAGSSLGQSFSGLLGGGGETGHTSQSGKSGPSGGLDINPGGIFKSLGSLF